MLRIVTSCSGRQTGSPGAPVRKRCTRCSGFSSRTHAPVHAPVLSVRLPPFLYTRARARRRVDAARADRHRIGQVAPAADQSNLLPHVSAGLKVPIAPALHDLLRPLSPRRIAIARASRCCCLRGARSGAPALGAVRWVATRDDAREPTTDHRGGGRICRWWRDPTYWSEARVLLLM